MVKDETRQSLTLQPLDRSVTLATVGGLLLNALELSMPGLALTVLAAAGYGLTRNRIENIHCFDLGNLPAHPQVNLRRFALICQWLGSRQLFEGLLGDLSDPELRRSEPCARRYLHSALWPALWLRLNQKISTLIWLHR
jgi:hypothetical protein